MPDEIVLFSGRIRTQRVRVWLEDGVDGISLLSHDIGPMLEPADPEILTRIDLARRQVTGSAR